MTLALTYRHLSLRVRPPHSGCFLDVFPPQENTRAPSRQFSSDYRQHRETPFHRRNPCRRAPGSRSGADPSKNGHAVLLARRFDPLVRSPASLRAIGCGIVRYPSEMLKSPPSCSKAVLRNAKSPGPTKVDPRYGQDFLDVGQGGHRLDLQPQQHLRTIAAGSGWSPFPLGYSIAACNLCEGWPDCFPESRAKDLCRPPSAHTPLRQRRPCTPAHTARNRGPVTHQRRCSS